MPPTLKKIDPARIATTVSTAKSRAGDDAAVLAAKQRARRDAAMKATGSMGKQAGAAVATEKRKADTFTNNVAASKVVAKAENVRKAGVFNSMFAQSKRPTVDVSIGKAVIEPSRSARVDFGKAVIESPSAKAARKPVPGGRPSRAVRSVLARAR